MHAAESLRVVFQVAKVIKAKVDGLKSQLGNSGHAGLPSRGPSLEPHYFTHCLGLSGHHHK